ncbi:alpha-amylase family glycosyl hydrolase [Horticoccus sp. 23ND18S-11]|uniref:alpha-amylase family glycosyl hydrolase n=1 Tax=Horticoccus sp. 23ND18S-11 TaxID=3391832 RepID=UPI0039C9F319
MSAPHRIVRAWLESPSSGLIELDRDWAGRTNPLFNLGKPGPKLLGLTPAAGLATGRSTGYFVDAASGEIAFVLPLDHGSQVDPERDTVFIAGDFNGWQAAVGKPEWRLAAAELDGGRCLIWRGPVADFTGWGQRFKFVTGEHQWLLPPLDAPNLVRDEHGNLNRVVDAARTGRHLWAFALKEPLSLAEPWTLGWGYGAGERVPMVPGPFFYELKTDLPMGARVRGRETTFRIFSPRARAVTLLVSREAGFTPEALEQAQSFPLLRRGDATGDVGVWEVTLDQNLHGWYYWYSIDGVREGPGPDGFDPTMRILDPYALATVGRDGPGIVLDHGWIGRGHREFKTPAWHDLVMMEVHVRDLATNAPVKAGAAERRGFTGLRKWVESADFYLHHLGVNCVELQPVHEFDNVTDDEYHWGYMTNNFFAPESSYALEPQKASGVHELQALVAAFHRRGMAVVVDVVFNHVGVPAHLMFVDKLYYFELDGAGALANWSGCGNDLRARSAMTRRLIIDSCLHYLNAFGVDGFRFDLAELLGVEVLRDIEAALKQAKPNVILIAEPWSFRGHIAGALRDTGWASWNDGYRDFVREYVRGNGEPARMEYFLRGSPWYFAKWPAQTVNYTESHDDRSWIDVITENPDHNGSHPTANDRRRTHLMAAILFMSLGIPMIAEGQDFLRSKHGVNNTYQRGDLNALDYRRLYRFQGTHAYFADWIAFRRGEYGRLLRHFTRPSEGFFAFIHAKGSPALAVVYNADLSQGAARLLFAINPTQADLTIPIGDAVAGTEPGAWDLLADHDRFYLSNAHGAKKPVESQLWVPSLSCGLWVHEG